MNGATLERFTGSPAEIEKTWTVPSRTDAPNELRILTSATVNPAQLGRSGDSRDLACASTRCHGRRRMTRAERVTVWLTALAVAITRWPALSRTMWDWDEALFALALRDYDVRSITRTRPASRCSSDSRS
jgi:hypothetical protein